MPPPKQDSARPPGPREVEGLFGRLSKRYDTLNRVLSLGRSGFWREALARRLLVRDWPGRFLDLATGSGDQLLAMRALWPQAELTGLDFAGPMLSVAREKIERLHPQDEVDLILGDALDPPFEDKTFDSVSLSFGLRAIPDRGRAYSQALRILKPGGRFLILELFHDGRALLSPFQRFYLEGVTPLVVGLFFRGREPGQSFLGDTVIGFPHPASIVDELRGAGFRGLGFQIYTFGSAMLVWGQRPIGPPAGA
jgi:demethylmenaquinone methyltransferase/2-methoxy-6-polyprenyl-1,4-benzoquinol methylase